MKLVERSEILDLGPYEQVRESFRRRIIELKRMRRIEIGSNITALFENHDTVLYQIQEMLRTERITREDAVLHELETYNELIPGKDELSVTFFIEYPDRDERERMLAALAGVEDKFYIDVAGTRVPVRNETRGTLSDRTTAVQYTKFALPHAAADIVRSGAKATVALSVDHPAYRARAELLPRTIEEIARDLTSSAR
jgi:Protein of unknown function (DUF3501)